MKTRTVTAKLFGIIALFLMLLIGAMLFLQSRYFGSYYVAQKKSSFAAASAQAAETFDGLTASDDELVSKLRALEKESGVIAFLFLPSEDALKALKMAGGKGGIILADKENLPMEILDILQKLVLTSGSNPNKIADPQDAQASGLDYLVSARPVTVNGQSYMLGMASSIQPVNEAIKALNSVSWLVYAFAIACSLALAIVISRLVARPLIREIAKEKALDNMRREFIANASHEMKTPISIISGYIESIRDGLLTPEERQEYELAIQDEAGKMGKLVRDMLEMALVQSEQSASQKAEVSIDGLIASLLRRFDGQIKGKSLQVEVDGPRPLPVHTDERLLETALVNLLSNAIYHTPEHGTISIRWGSGKDHCHMEVENDGAPIPEEALPHIWEAFYRADKSHNREAGRYGLGLSIVRAIAGKLGGAVGVQNTARGVKFFFDL